MQPSFHRSLPAELQVMPFVIRMMDAIGMRGPRRNFIRFVLALGWGIFVIILPKMVLGVGSSEFSAITKGLGELLFHTNLFAAMVIVVLNMASFERMIQLLSEIIRDVTAEDQPREYYDLIREQNSKVSKFTKFYFVYCCIGPSMFCIPAMATSYFRYFVTTNGSDPIQFELPMEQEFYGLQIRTNFVHYHLFVACSLPAYYIGGYISVIMVVSLLVMIRYSSLTYRLVALRIQKLAQFGEVCPKRKGAAISGRSKVDEVVEIVQLHDKALQVTELVEEIVNIPLAMQFLTCILFWCLVILYVSKNFDITLLNVTIPFWLSLLETYGFSYLGSELTDSAEAVGEAIYELRWYEDSVQLQRYYRLILQRAQRAKGVTAAKFFVVGIANFGKVVNTSYSYYLVLKDTLNEL